MIITYLCPSCLQSCWWGSGAGKGLLCAFPAPSAGGSSDPLQQGSYTIPTGFMSITASFGNGGQRGARCGVESPCSLLPDGERKQHLDFLSPAGLESLAGQQAVFSALQCPLQRAGSRGKVGTQPTSTKLCPGVREGGSAVPCAPLLQLRARLALCGRERAHPGRLITVTQELRSAGTEKAEGSTSRAAPNPVGAASHP